MKIKPRFDFSLIPVEPAIQQVKSAALMRQVESDHLTLAQVLQASQFETINQQRIFRNDRK